ncbi:MAG: glycoside hydrolase family 3 C-terminal domain-containing protein [Bacteroidota bacterium]
MKIKYLAIALASMFALTAKSQVLTIEQKIEAILSQMTLDEKCHQLYPLDVLNTGDNPRFGIPGFYCTDGPHGYRYPESTGGNVGYYLAPPEAFATSFPVSIGVSATWDPDLAMRMARAMANEFRANGINLPLAPSLYLCNDPRHGRSAESYGEDPYLCSKIGVGTVKGIQSTGAMACIKAFLCENAQATRMTDTMTISRRMIMEHWGLPYKFAIQDANALSVMSAYVAVNGIAASQSFDLNTAILRNKLGFPYFMVSDWGSVHNSKEAIHSGLDLDMGSVRYAYDLKAGVVDGSIPLADVDNAVRNILRTKLLAGVIDFQPVVSKDVISGMESQTLDYETGVKSMVLLKNENSILPLNKSTINSVALIGPGANDCRLDGYGSSFVFPTYSITPKAAIEQRVGSWKVKYQKGCDINSADTNGFADAISKAASSDVVIFVGGLDITQEGEMKDRVGGSVQLPTNQQSLINALSSVNPNIIVVMESGGIVSLAQCLQNIKGLIYGFYPGQEQGRAIADILFGDYNPGGKLPVTMPANDSQIPPDNTNYNDDWGSGYRWYDKQGYTPSYAFGYGLSYTSFSYNSIQTVSNSIQAGETISLSVNVTNTGLKEGDEVIQLYVSHPASSLPMPIKQLKAFKRVNFQAGETKTISFELKPEDLYVFDELLDNYVLLNGTYQIKVGGSSDNLPLNTSINVNSATTKPDYTVPTIVCYPPFPHQGDTVFFALNIKNEGTGISTGNIQANVYVNNQMIAQLDTNISISLGNMKQLSAKKALMGKNYWIATSAGTYTLKAEINPNLLISETNSANNTTEQEFKVYDSYIEPIKINLALKKPVIASSEYNASTYSANWAVDGLRFSRWSSNFTNNESIQVDLMDNYNLKNIIIKWEAAFASKYLLCTSINGTQWDTIVQENYGNGKIDDFNLDINARYIKILCKESGSPWGFSIYEIEAYGLPLTFITSTESENKNTENSSVFPNPINDVFTVNYVSTSEKSITIGIYDLQGKLILKTLNNSVVGKNQFEINNISSIPSGVYYLKIEDERQNKYIKIIKQ